jgi:hypothetical protein
MQRTTKVYSGELTFSDLALEGMDGVQGARAAFKGLTVWLRKKARQEGWAYDFRLSLSTSKPSIFRRRPARIHGHFIFIGNPGTTIAKFIKKYWHHRYGMVSLERLGTAEDVRRKTKYIDLQADFTWKQKLGAELLGGGLSDALHEAVPETNHRLESEHLSRFARPEHYVLDI